MEFILDYLLFLIKGVYFPDNLYNIYVITLCFLATAAAPVRKKL